MAYSLNKLRDELVSKNLSSNGLVAWGQNTGMGGILASATTPMFVISSNNNKIIIIPFNNKEIIYDGGIMFDITSIASAKICGFWLYSKLKIKTLDGKIYTYSITQGKSNLKKMLSSLGF